MKFDKPIYVDVSKTCLWYMNFTTSTCCRSFIKNVKLCIHGQLYLSYRVRRCLCFMKHDINRFEMSDYMINNAYNILLINKKVPDLIKDENNVQLLPNSSRLERKCMPCASMVKKMLRR